MNDEIPRIPNRTDSTETRMIPLSLGQTHRRNNGRTHPIREPSPGET